ncbi:hypothetical protein F5Y12DRAFT_723211 [Xylaria sp. FL1777]|nr:hypothetical protein F5Y12DRAFT_723211 [Xylaria sp. FL1777]
MTRVSSNTTAHTPARAAASMAITHPALVWPQVLEQRQIKKSTKANPIPIQHRSSSAASVFSESSEYSYGKEISTSGSKSLFQKIKEFFY